MFFDYFKPCFVFLGQGMAEILIFYFFYFFNISNPAKSG